MRLQQITEDQYNQAVLTIGLSRQELLGLRATVRELANQVQTLEGEKTRLEDDIEELETELAALKDENKE